ncbi:MAG: peroxiredoxin [Flammeovirgaceae bacterium]|jgi:peroxiredoxin
MNLLEELKAKKEASAKKIPVEKRAIMANSINQLVENGLAKGALNVGDQMMDFTLPNALGKNVSFAERVQKGKVVISFYRGGWCPYCNMELRALQEILPEIESLNSSLMAISPEVPDESLNTSEKNELSFDVLSDIDNKLAKEIGLVFQMPADLREVYQTFNIDVSKHNGNEDYELPLSATYVVNQNGIIEYAFGSEDYTERADPQEILKSLKS